MSSPVTICNQCRTPVTPGSLDRYENVDGFMYHCSVCDNYLFTRPYPKVRNEFALTPDEITYTIHCLGKQMLKLDHARQQLHSAVAKLEIMLETAKEECNAH